jgi:hypothetical protein
MGVQAAGYPITVAVTTERTINRWWGIPFIGVFVRAILAIPHVIVLFVLGIGIYIWFILSFIVILVLGKVPDIVISLMREYLQRSYRVMGWAYLLLPAPYPPLGTGPSEPVLLQLNIADNSINRWWGIPFVGIFVRFVVAIPHLIILSVLAIVLYIVVLIVWIPILVMGRYPDWAASFAKMFMGYAARVTAWLVFLPVPYPPFSFE